MNFKHVKYQRPSYRAQQIEFCVPIQDFEPFRAKTHTFAFVFQHPPNSRTQTDPPGAPFRPFSPTVPIRGTTITP
jgi:hypothetical protein